MSKDDGITEEYRPGVSPLSNRGDISVNGGAQWQAEEMVGFPAGRACVSAIVSRDPPLGDQSLSPDVCHSFKN